MHLASVICANFLNKKKTILLLMSCSLNHEFSSMFVCSPLLQIYGSTMTLVLYKAFKDTDGELIGKDCFDEMFTHRPVIDLLAVSRWVEFVGSLVAFAEKRTPDIRNKLNYILCSRCHQSIQKLWFYRMLHFWCPVPRCGALDMFMNRTLR